MIPANASAIFFQNEVQLTCHKEEHIDKRHEAFQYKQRYFSCMTHA